MTKATVRLSIAIAILLFLFPDSAHTIILMTLALISDLINLIVWLLRVIQIGIDQAIQNTL